MDAAIPAGPRASAWRRFRGPVLLAVAVVAVALAGVLVQADRNAAVLDPAGTSEEGSRALAVLLRDRGVAVDRVPTVAVARQRAGRDVTVFVPVPGRIPAQQLGELGTVGAGSLVVIDPSAEDLRRLVPGASRAGSVPVRERLPSCDLPAAVTAGSAELGGTTYALAGSSDSGAGTGCYPAGGEPTVIERALGDGRVTVVGTPRPFTNGGLDEGGNAALALRLLGGGSRVLWLLPPAAQPAAEGGQRPLAELLPDRLVLAVFQVGIAVVLLGLWRARRFGPVVSEELPIVVRAAETTEGRARLYRATRSRATAAAALRTGTRTRLARRLGLESGPAAALVDAAARRSGRRPSDVHPLLYGGEDPGASPADDAALVRLAQDLDALDADVRRF